MATKPPKPEAKVEAVQSHAGLIQTLKTRRKGRPRTAPLSRNPYFLRKDSACRNVMKQLLSRMTPTAPFPPQSEQTPRPAGKIPHPAAGATVYPGAKA